AGGAGGGAGASGGAGAGGGPGPYLGAPERPPASGGPVRPAADLGRFAEVDPSWPPPGTVLHLICPRCSTACKLTDRLARAAYPTGDHRPVCMRCDLEGDVVELRLVKVLDVVQEQRALRALEEELARVLQRGLAPAERGLV